MKIVRTPSLTDASASLRVLVLDSKHRNPNRYIVLSVLEALKGNPHVQAVFLAEYESVVSEARSGCYDLLLVLDGEALALDLVVRASAYCRSTMLWSWEDPYETSTMLPIAGVFDHIFTNDLGSVARYPAATFLPLAASPSADYRVLRSDADFAYDISFVGSAWPNRVRFLRKLLRSRPHLKSRLVLAFNPYLPTGYLDLPETDYKGYVSHFDFIEIANRSKIVLTLHRDFAGGAENYSALSPGPRIFEAALAGGFQLVDGVETNIEEFFASDSIDIFHSFDECLKKIDEALANPAARCAKALRAQERAADVHLYDNRVSQIVELALGVPARVAQATMRRKRRLLFVTHNTVSGGNFGGVEVYQETIVSNLSEEFDIFFYRPERARSNDQDLCFVITDADGAILEQFVTPNFDTSLKLTDRDVEAAFSRILNKFQIDLVHYHHLIGHVPSLPIISNMKGIPSIYTNQDFYLTCHRYNLLDETGRYCRIHERPRPTTCDICLSVAEHRPEGSQAYRRTFMSRVFSSFDRVIGNSPSAVAISSGIYSRLSEQTTIISLGLPLPKRAGTSWKMPEATRVSGREAAPRCQIVFLGNFSRNKGADLFLKVATQLVDAPVDFHICGRVDSPYEKILESSSLHNVTVHGLFAPGSLDLSRFDVSLHLSNWPETYCITLSEAWAAGVVPIVTDVGALADRVTHNVNGLIVPIDGSGELLYTLNQVIYDPSFLSKLKDGITPNLWLTAEQHVAELSKVYHDLIKSHAQHGSIDTATFGPPIDLSLSGITLGSKFWDKPDDLAAPALRADEHGERPHALSSQELAGALDNLDSGKVEATPQTALLFSQFGPYFPALSGDDLIHRPPLKARLRWSGRERRPQVERKGARTLVLRSLDEIIFRSLTEIVAYEVVADGFVGSEAELVSELVSLELLADDWYSVEVATCRPDRLQLLYTGIAIHGGKSPRVLAGRGPACGLATPRVPFRRLWGDIATALGRASVNAASLRAGLELDTTVLDLDITVPIPSFAPVAVKIGGEVEVFAAVEAVNSYSSTDGAAQIRVAAILAGLPLGQYALSVLGSDPEGALLTAPLDLQVKIAAEGGVLK